MTQIRYLHIAFESCRILTVLAVMAMLLIVGMVAQYLLYGISLFNLANSISIIIIVHQKGRTA